jgi:hypothetical protein
LFALPERREAASKELVVTELLDKGGDVVGLRRLFRVGPQDSDSGYQQQTNRPTPANNLAWLPP